MAVQTVCGLVSAEELGVVCPHEHLVCDLTALYGPRADPHAAASGASEDLRAGDLRLDDPVLAAEELRRYRAAGGGTIVDVTLRDIGRDPLALRALSEATGVHVVMGAGWYVAASHPADMPARDVDELAAELVRELRVGADGTGIRAGIIGEIGTSPQPTAQERKVVRAAARAQLETGAAITLHACSATRHAIELLELIGSEGVTDLGRVIVGHQDCVLDHDYHREVLRAGALVELDLFGHAYYASEGFQLPTDAERVDMVVALCEKGFADRLLLSHDICMRAQWHCRGGVGYAHLSTEIEPLLRARGLDDDAIDRLRRHNPARVLDLAPSP
ncbi:MAG TPA: hypothetical protein VFF79_10370 [Conexibacter sp.]|jgi:phosphotriesterase-related protein|nr:hypothetical protein [Conexibacter sp.]